MTAKRPQATLKNLCWRSFSLLVLAVMLLAAASARACDIPVHRYLLVRWQREPYRVYYFYRGQEHKADAEVNEFFNEVGSAFGSHVNLFFRTVDVDRLGDSPLAEVEREVWEEHRSDNLPFHVVVSPRGTEVFSGRLDLTEARAMVQSPFRKRIAGELCSKEGGLLLLLTRQDQKENQRAEKDVRWVLETAKREHQLDVGYLRLSEKAAEERWLVRFLLHIAGDPEEREGCVLFGICGRGRVIAACIGEGITRRNVIECVSIMNGDCSCDLRFMNPGMDLLTDWDWEAATANIPLFSEETLRSVLLGFDDFDESPAEAPPQESHAPPKGNAKSVFRRWTLDGWGLAFGIAGVVVIGLGLIMIRKRREL